MPARREKVDVSLFPFLSVLCTVIAVMVLLGIMILNTRVVAKAEQGYKKVTDGVPQPRPGSERDLPIGMDIERCRQLEEEVAQLNKTLDERKNHLAVVTNKFKAFQDLLESKITLMEVERIGTGREPGAPDPIAMVPVDGQEVRLTPIFVEVKADGYTVHPSKQHFPAIKTPTDLDTMQQLDASPDLRVFLRKVDSRRQHEYLVFLIHPNGAAAFDGIRLFLRLNYSKLRMGWEPFARTWIVSDSQQE